MKNDLTYEVWWSMGTGTHTGPRFRNLRDAIRYVSDHWGEASFAIKTGEDRWHHWDDGQVMTPRRPNAA